MTSSASDRVERKLKVSRRICGRRRRRKKRERKRKRRKKWRISQVLAISQYPAGVVRSIGKKKTEISAVGTLLDAHRIVLTEGIRQLEYFGCIRWKHVEGHPAELLLFLIAFARNSHARCPLPSPPSPPPPLPTLVILRRFEDAPGWARREGRARGRASGWDLFLYLRFFQILTGCCP